jgi:hypothetical protein
LAFGFPAFFIVADGGEPNFQIYSTELIARDFVNALLPKNITPRATVSKPLPFELVATAGWSEDTLNQVCQNDHVDFAGALVVKFTSFITDANWLLFNTETQHVSPSFFFAGCRDSGKPDPTRPPGNEVYTLVHLTPEIRIHTVKSDAQWTIPIAPVTALATLFTFKGNTNAAYQVKYGILLLTTSLGGLNGNFGVYNPGHEALSAAAEVSHDAVMLTLKVCDVQPSAGRGYDAPGLGDASPPLPLVGTSALPTPAPASSPFVPQQLRTQPATMMELCDNVKSFRDAAKLIDPDP